MSYPKAFDVRQCRRIAVLGSKHHHSVPFDRTSPMDVRRVIYGRRRSTCKSAGRPLAFVFETIHVDDALHALSKPVLVSTTRSVSKRRRLGRGTTRLVTRPTQQGRGDTMCNTIGATWITCYVAWGVRHNRLAQAARPLPQRQERNWSCTFACRILQWKT